MYSLAEKVMLGVSPFIWIGSCLFCTFLFKSVWEFGEKYYSRKNAILKVKYGGC